MAAWRFLFSSKICTSSMGSGHLRVDVTVARRGVRHLQRHLAGAFAFARAGVERDLDVGDAELAVGPLRQTQVDV